MAYSAEDIFSQYRKTFVVAPFKTKQVTPLGYDLKLGCCVVYDSKGDYIEQPKGSRALYVIPPMGFAFIVTLDRVCLSGKVLGTVHARARLSMRGLMMNSVTVDPNFGNPQRDSNKHNEEFVGSRLLLRVSNASSLPITLTAKDDSIATLVLHDVNTETKRKPKMSSFNALIEELEKNLKGVGTPAGWDAIKSYIELHSKTTDSITKAEKTNEHEIELMTAIDEMIHYRERLAHSK
jgi:deoxycytidine triphosphate deaminase